MTEPLLQPRPDGRRRIDRVLAGDYLDDLRAALPRRGPRPAARGRAGGGRPLLPAPAAAGPHRPDPRRAAAPGRHRRRVARRPARDVLADGPRATHGSGPAHHRRAVPGGRAPPPGRAAHRRRRPVRRRGAHARTSSPAPSSVLDEHERQVSELRHRVQAVMDACTAEIGRRYRDGEADVSALLEAEAQPEA